MILTVYRRNNHRVSVATFDTATRRFKRFDCNMNPIPGDDHAFRDELDFKRWANGYAEHWSWHQKDWYWAGKTTLADSDYNVDIDL